MKINAVTGGKIRKVLIILFCAYVLYLLYSLFRLLTVFEDQERSGKTGMYLDLFDKKTAQLLDTGNTVFFKDFSPIVQYRSPDDKLAIKYPKNSPQAGKIMARPNDILIYKFGKTVQGKSLRELIEIVHKNTSKGAGFYTVKGIITFNFNLREKGSEPINKIFITSATEMSPIISSDSLMSFRVHPGDIIFSINEPGNSNYALEKNEKKSQGRPSELILVTKRDKVYLILNDRETDLGPSVSFD